MWRYGLVFLFPFLYTAVLSAQNILQEDSVWGSVGKDTIRLNPEYLKAIENGTLINIGQPLELESSRTADSDRFFGIYKSGYYSATVASRFTSSGSVLALSGRYSA